MTLSLSEVKVNFSKVDFTKLPKPSRNKGDRGQLLELALGIPNSSNLTDMVDGELKTYTRGESIAVTQLKHVLPEIFNKIPFSQTKVGKKLQQTLYVGFDRDNNFLDSITLSREVDLRHYQELEEDFNYITEVIRYRYNTGKELSTITGKNGLLQIRTKDSKDRKGNYHPIKWKGYTLKDKGMAFYLTAKFGKELM